MSYPDAWAAHPPALEAEEDLHLHELSFLGPPFPMRIGATELLARVTPAPDRMYEELRTTLKCASSDLDEDAALALASQELRAARAERAA